MAAREESDCDEGGSHARSTLPDVAALEAKVSCLKDVNTGLHMEVSELRERESRKWKEKVQPVVKRQLADYDAIIADK